MRDTRVFLGWPQGIGNAVGHLGCGQLLPWGHPGSTEPISCVSLPRVAEVVAGRLPPHPQPTPHRRAPEEEPGGNLVHFVSDVTASQRRRWLLCRDDVSAVSVTPIRNCSAREHEKFGVQKKSK